MRRADRLFQIVQYLRSRRVTTASWLAQKLEVSARTVYRDIQDLILSGVPVEGEAGVGYALRRSLDLPPLHFTRDELVALDVGLRFVAGRTTPGLSRAAGTAHAKIRWAVSPGLLPEAARQIVFVPATRAGRQRWLAELTDAIATRRKLQVAYRSESGERTDRTLRPLGLFYWGKAWTLTAWCELRDDFRTFRLERIETLAPLEGTFADEAGKRLEDYLHLMERVHRVPRSDMNPELA